MKDKTSACVVTFVELKKIRVSAYTRGFCMGALVSGALLIVESIIIARFF